MNHVVRVRARATERQQIAAVVEAYQIGGESRRPRGIGGEGSIRPKNNPPIIRLKVLGISGVVGHSGRTDGQGFDRASIATADIPRVG